MSSTPTFTIKLAAKLVYYLIEKNMAGDFVSATLGILTPATADDLLNLLVSGEEASAQAQHILAAFKIADETFVRHVRDERLRQAILSQPMAGLPTLEKLAANLPDTLDDLSLYEALYKQFKTDWPSQLVDKQCRKAARLYVECLENGLAIKCNQFLPILLIKINRIEKENKRTQATRQREDMDFF